MEEDSTDYVIFRIYEELSDLLPERLRKRTFRLPLPGRRSVKDAIESLNIPHTEVDLILINGVSVNFNAILNPGDRISVYPLFESLDISNIQKLRPLPLRIPKFICDVHLGGLAAKLRLLGFDTLYRNDYSDPAIIDIQEQEQRAILTCDRNLLKPNRVIRGYLVRSREVQKQIREVIRRFDLRDNLRPFSRCPACNGNLIAISSEEAGRIAPAGTAEWMRRFQKCSACGKLYWPGSHHSKIVKWIKSL